MIEKDKTFELITDIVKSKGMICLHCTFRDSNRCLHAQMRVNRSDKQLVEGELVSFLEHFTIPYYDFFCGYWTEQK